MHIDEYIAMNAITYHLHYIFTFVVDIFNQF